MPTVAIRSRWPAITGEMPAGKAAARGVFLGTLSLLRLLWKKGPRDEAGALKSAAEGIFLSDFVVEAEDSAYRIRLEISPFLFFIYFCKNYKSFACKPHKIRLFDDLTVFMLE